MTRTKQAQTIARMDVHCPSAIVPDDYDYVAQELQAHRRRIQEHMQRTGGTYSRHEHGGTCMVCGSVNAFYTILFHHRPSNTYVRMGSDCAEKCRMGGDYNTSAFRTVVQDARKAQAGKKKAKAILSDEGLTRCWETFDTHRPYAESHWEEDTIGDIVGKLVKYGSISEKQTAFLRSLLDRIDTRVEREAKRKAERALADDCPTGKMVVTGVVVKTDLHENDYGVRDVMTVKDDRGFLVWGTSPRAFSIEKGDHVTFSATVTPSSKDAKFGFFKRPTKTDVLSGPWQPRS